jgi:hypothetical protein
MDDAYAFVSEQVIKAVVFALVGIAALWLTFGVLNLQTRGEFPHIDSDKWQAVFLENDQVYFGRLEEYDQNYVRLSDVYYLKEATDLQTKDANLNLIKLGGEVHGPEDEMFVRKEAIVYWENMKEESRVVESIKAAKLKQ